MSFWPQSHRTDMCPLLHSIGRSITFICFLIGDVDLGHLVSVVFGSFLSWKVTILNICYLHLIHHITIYIVTPFRCYDSWCSYILNRLRSQAL